MLLTEDIFSLNTQLAFKTFKLTGSDSLETTIPVSQWKHTL